MKIYLVLDVIFLVVMTILLINDNSVSWWYVLVGFIMGITLHELLTFFRDRERARNQRKLR